MMNLISEKGHLVLKVFRGSMTLYSLERYVSPLPLCSFGSAVNALL